MNEPTLPSIIKFPASMVCLYGFMQKVAHKHGYALACHGSMNRDFDLIAVPWVERPSTTTVLAHAIAKSIGAHIPSYVTPESGKAHVPNPTIKPHGRECWVIPMGGGPYVDLSVMPPLETLPDDPAELATQIDIDALKPGPGRD